MQDIIVSLFDETGLGQVTLPIVPVSGGFMHRMYRVTAGGKVYAVKHLNPNIMQRPDAMENYRRAERLEQILKNAGLPVAAAMTLNGSKMQEVKGEHFYIFGWQEGSITDRNNISLSQCTVAGELQGRIHSIEERRTVRKPEPCRISWDQYIQRALAVNNEIALYLEQNRELLEHAQDELNRARSGLPDIECITDEDMDPKNVMWHEGRPVIIDLECLDYGNPASDALQLSLQWAGVTVCSVDIEKLRAFFKGYLAVYDNGFRAYDSIFGLAYTWLEWLEYNVDRALGQCQDEAERQMGITEVKNTINRIRYINDNRDKITGILSELRKV